jgi:hypothetical protein
MGKINKIVQKMMSFIKEQLTENGKWSFGRVGLFISITIFFYVIILAARSSFVKNNDVDSRLLDTALSWLYNLILVLTAYVFGSKGWGLNQFIDLGKSKNNNNNNNFLNEH